MKRRPRSSGSSFVLGLYLLLVCSSLGLMIFTNTTLLSGGNDTMNDDYEAKMFALSALKTVSANIAETNVSYRTDMGLDELDAAARAAGFGAFSGYLSHALYSIAADPGVDYCIPFVMSLQQQKLIIKLDFVVESRTLDISVIVREVIIKGEPRTFSGIRNATFGATVFENTGETTEVLLSYDGGRYE